MNDEGTPAPARRPMNLLIVDDSSTMRNLIKRVLAVTGLRVGEVYEAGNGREALDVLETHDVEVLLTDLNMPVMTGTELLRIVDANPRWRSLRRVIISTDGSTARRAEVARLHVRCYLEKPITPEVVRDVLTAVTDVDLHA
jgi:two-component system chemotaxis response regulator CheY